MMDFVVHSVFAEITMETANPFALYHKLTFRVFVVKTFNLSHDEIKMDEQQRCCLIVFRSAVLID